MSGDAALGSVLRELRTARGLTLAAVARQAGCTESFVSYVETGKRQVHPWLAEKLDQIYRTGSAVTSLARGNGTPQKGHCPEVPRSDAFVVQLPRNGPTLPLGRREVMASLGGGIVHSSLQAEFERALDSLDLDSQILQHFEGTWSFFKEAANMLPPTQLIDGMTGDVAILDGLRRRAVGADRRRCGKLQTRYANWLSWMSQEAGDVTGALWWNDRAAQWAQATFCSNLIAWNFIRRSAMAHQFSGDGLRVVDEASPVLEMPDTSPRMQGIAAGQITYGHALASKKSESYRALDMTIDRFLQPIREEDVELGQATIPSDELVPLYQTTIDVYLGHGARVARTLDPLSDSLAKKSLRVSTIAKAKLARAYANAGQPDEACRVAREALDAAVQVGSQLARIELRRALPVLNRWHGRSDVRDVVHRLQN